MFFQTFRTEMEIWQMRRDDFRQRIKQGDEQVLSHFASTIGDKNVVEEVIKIWQEMIRKDEDLVKDKWVKKIESTRKAYEKDKREHRKSSRDYRNNDNDSRNDVYCSPQFSGTRCRGVGTNETDDTSPNDNNSRNNTTRDESVSEYNENSRNDYHSRNNDNCKNDDNWRNNDNSRRNDDQSKN